MKHFSLLFFYLIFSKACLLAQVDPIILASGLRAPVGIDMDEGGNLWVAEQGIGVNDGAVTVIWKDGTVQRVIDSLTNVFIPDEQITEGPVRVQVIDDYIYVFAPMAESPSELGTLIFDRKAITKGGTSLRKKDILTTIRINDAVVKAGREESHPYSVVSDGCDLYFADAAANAIYHKDGKSGVIKEFVGFPSIPNPLPFGPPFIDAVPTRIIHNPAGGFYVSQLTGFPFLPDAAKIFKVSDNGKLSTAFENLSVVTDISLSPDGNGIYALELTEFNFDSLNPFVINTSKIIHLKENGSRDTLFTGFGPSAGFTLDKSGNCIVTNLFFGTVMKLKKGINKVTEMDAEHFHKLHLYPNPTGETLYFDFISDKAKPAALIVYDIMGRKVYSTTLNNIQSGLNKMQISTSAWNAISNQSYLVKVINGDEQHYGLLIKN